MDNTQYLKDLADAEKRAKQTELQQAKESSLLAIEQEKAKTMPTFTANKQATNVASQVGAKNLAEFWAQRGQTNAGINAQAEMSNQNVLGRDIGAINKQEQQAVVDYGNQSLAANTLYQNNLLNANNTIDQNLTTNLYNDRAAQQAAQVAAEKEAYQRQQDAEANRLAWYNATKGGKEKTAAVNTNYYQGKINPNTKLGVFETLDAYGVKYQPNNVGTYTYTANGKTVKATNTLKKYGITVGKYAEKTGNKYQGYSGADISNQNVWLDKQNKAWYWDGSINDYRAL